MADTRPALRDLITQSAIVCSVAIYAWIVWLSQRFEFGSDTRARPLVLVISLFLVLSVLYLIICWWHRRTDDWLSAIVWILFPAMLFRCIVLASDPIQEVDLYRYLWDGATQRAGVSPYKLAPLASWPERWVRPNTASQFHDARALAAPDELAALRDVRESDSSLRETLRRVHFAHVSTVYPPVSQLGFRLVDSVTPRQCTIRVRINMMRGWLVICDLATLLTVMGILSHTGKPLGLSALYGWCPLIIKEIANSGHLDSMAVLITTLAIYAVVRLWSARMVWQVRVWITLAGVLLGLGVAAKVYPIVLTPWLGLVVLKRRGALSAGGVVFAAVAVACVAMLPMLSHERSRIDGSHEQGGLSTFAQYWEMNDFLFLIVVENLKPRAEVEERESAWFSVLPDSVRRSVVSAIFGRLPDALAQNPHNAPFMAARCLTGIAYVLTACWILLLTWRSDSIEDWLAAGFLTIAWFFLWGPTQNPWYWLWAMPLLPFARSRSWWLLSPLLFFYYLRFWLDYHFAGKPVAGTEYEGEDYFHLVVTWFEFAPWFLLLVGEQLWRSRRRWQHPSNTQLEA